MSRWLTSVNNLLETLDGQAGTVAETVAEVGNQGVAGIDNQIGKLLNRTRNESYSSDDYTSEDDYDDAEEELYSEVDEVEDEGFHQTNTRLAFPAAKPNATTMATRAQPPSVVAAAAAPDFSWKEDELPESKSKLVVPAMNMNIKNEKQSDDYKKWEEIQKEDWEPNDDSSDKVGLMDTAHKSSKHSDDGVSMALGRNNSKTSSPTEVYAPPRTPNRAPPPPNSIPKTHLSRQQDAKLQKASIDPQGTTGRLASQHHSYLSQPPTSSPKVDESPRQPRRSLEGNEMSPMLAAKISLMIPDEPPVPMTGAKAVTAAALHQPKLTHDSIPPRLPARKASDKEQKALESAEAGTTWASSASGATASHKSTGDPTRAPAAASVSPTPESAPVPAPVATAANPKLSKEYQKLKERYQALQTQMNQTDAELKNAQSKSQTLQKEIKSLNSKLEEANNEIHAQGEELQRAGDRMEKDRLRAKEDREDLLDEQEEELEQLRDSHQSEMDQLRNRYEAQVSDLKQQLEAEETRRRQEGGDYTQELQDAIQRERDALKKLNQEITEKTELQSSLSKLELQQTALQARLDSVVQSGKAAAEREREAEDKLDAAMSLHARQMSQRQSREAELEKTISELGTALTVAQQQTITSGTPAKVDRSAKDTMRDSYKEKYESTAEELETLKVQFGMESQRREALQVELNDISKERAQEASSTLARQRTHDRKVLELESSVSRLQASLRERSNVNGKTSQESTLSGSSPGASSRDLEEAKREIENLSSQLLRHQAISKNAKSEILALKGRLQTATSRAEQAEKSLHTISSARSRGLSTNGLYELEAGVASGPTGLRRRVKGGGARARTRTIRAALQMSPGRTNHPFMEQLALTLDAIDTWMVETGSFMRHEPLARLGFMMYLMTLHLWSFALVVFHTTEQPHGDFGSMDNNPRHWRAAAAQPP